MGSFLNRCLWRDDAPSGVVAGVAPVPKCPERKKKANDINATATSLSLSLSQRLNLLRCIMYYKEYRFFDLCMGLLKEC